MRISNNRQNELDVLRYFAPLEINATNKDLEKYFDWSERGLHKQEADAAIFRASKKPSTGFEQLVIAKKYAGRTIHELWEDGVLEGSIPYFTLLGGEDYREMPPRAVVDFLKREIFRGSNKELIEKLYNEIVEYWTWPRRRFFDLKLLIKKLT